MDIGLCEFCNTPEEKEREDTAMRHLLLHHDNLITVPKRIIHLVKKGGGIKPSSQDPKIKRNNLKNNCDNIFAQWNPTMYNGEDEIRGFLGITGHNNLTCDFVVKFDKTAFAVIEDKDSKNNKLMLKAVKQLRRTAQYIEAQNGNVVIFGLIFTKGQHSKIRGKKQKYGRNHTKELTFKDGRTEKKITIGQKNVPILIGFYGELINSIKERVVEICSEYF